MSKTNVLIKLMVNETEVVIENDEIVYCRVVQETDPMSVLLPVDTMEASIYTDNPGFSIFSDGSFFVSLSEFQKMKLYVSKDGVETLIGTFFLTEIEQSGDYTFNLKAVNILGLLDSISYEGGLWTNARVADLLDFILNENSIEYEIDLTLGVIECSGRIAPCTCREALQQVCFANGLMVSSSNDSRLIFSASYIAAKDSGDFFLRTITKHEIAEDRTVSLLPFVSKINLMSHSWEESGTEVSLFSAEMSPGNYKITFDKPCYNISATGVGYIPEYLATEDSDYLMSEDGDYLILSGEYVYGANSIYLDVLEPGGEVTITGYLYEEKLITHTYTNPNIAGLTKKRELVFDSATLVSEDNAETVLANLATYYNQRYVENARLIVYGIPVRFYGEGFYGDPSTYQPPALLMGDKVRISAPRSKFINGMIERMDTDITGGLIIEMKVLGIEEGI